MECDWRRAMTPQNLNQCLTKNVHLVARSASFEVSWGEVSGSRRREEGQEISVSQSASVADE